MADTLGCITEVVAERLADLSDQPDAERSDETHGDR